MRSYWLTLALLSGIAILSSVSQPSAFRMDSWFGSHSEQEEGERARTHTPGDARSIAAITGRLKQAVNAESTVRNLCQSQGREVRIEESTEISEANGCQLIVKTLKTSTSGSERRELRFTLHANLAELTTPSSVETQRFSQCKPIDGTVLKVMSRTQPGKTVQTTRRTTSEKAGATEDRDAPARTDLSFFFPNAVSARKAARLLDRAVKICGGTEWPDEDDLP